MSAVRGFCESEATPDAESTLAHQARHALVIHMHSAVTQLVRHAPVTIARDAAINLGDQGDQALVRERGLARRRAVVVRTARKADHLASPSNGAATGPLTIREASLIAAGRSRGIF